MDAFTRSLLLLAILVMSCGTTRVATMPSPQPQRQQDPFAEISGKYLEAQLRAQREAETARISQQRALEAKAAEEVAGKAFARELKTKAQETEGRAAWMRQRSCELDPSLCEDSKVSQQSVKSSDFVDARIVSFTEGGFTRLTDYPSGWQLLFLNGRIVLFIGQVAKASIGEFSGSCPGTCFRFTAERVFPVDCPQ